jgi:hypothetical protein
MEKLPHPVFREEWRGLSRVENNNEQKSTINQFPGAKNWRILHGIC